MHPLFGSGVNLAHATKCLHAWRVLNIHTYICVCRPHVPTLWVGSQLGAGPGRLGSEGERWYVLYALSAIFVVCLVCSGMSCMP